MIAKPLCIGMNKTYELCRSLYFWPGMFNDIRQMIRSDGGPQFRGEFAKFCVENA